MTLTHDDVKILERQFEPQEHLINYEGYAYIDEWALKPRLDAVDPAWAFSIEEVTVRDGEHRPQVVVRGTLTIRGVSRSGIGMAETTLTKKDKSIKDIEAEKNAATDCLRRCARLFGCGAYLLRAGTFKDMKALTNWLQGNKPALPKQRANPNNGTPKKQPQQKQVLLADVRRKESKDKKKKWLSFTTSGGLECSAWSSTPFKESGYIAETDWAKDKIGDVWVIDPQIPCVINLNDKGRYIIDVSSIPEYKPEWDGLHEGTPGTDEEFGDVPL